MRHIARRACARLLHSTEGVQLLEFALTLPVLLVMAVGIFDFGAAYNLKQKMTNGAREGVRIAVNQSPADLTQPIPGSIQSIRDAVVNYLNGENVNTTMFPAAPTQTAPMQWTYYSTASGAPLLVIDRGRPVPVTSGGVTTLIISSRVALNYDYTWSFHRIMKLLQPSSNYAGSFVISTDVTMRNLQ